MRLGRSLFAFVCGSLVGAVPMSAMAQQPGGVRPVIDTIVVEVDNVFRAQEATTPGKRFMNTLHVPTKRHVIRHQLDSVGC